MADFNWDDHPIVSPKEETKSNSDFNWEDHPITQSTPTTSMLEAFGRGGLESATLGFSDELSGMLSGDGNALGGMKLAKSYLTGEDVSQDPDVIEYIKSRDITRRAQEMAAQEYPVAHFLGGLALPIPVLAGASKAAKGLGLLSKAAKAVPAAETTLLGLAKTGAKVGAPLGAVQGVGVSQEGDVEGLLSDAAMGTALGAGTGAVLSPAIGAVGMGARKIGKEVVSPAIDKSLLKVNEMLESIKGAPIIGRPAAGLASGLRGTKLYSKAERSAFADEALQKSKQIVTEQLLKPLKSADEFRKSIEASAIEQGIEVPSKEVIDDIVSTLKNIDPASAEGKQAVEYAVQRIAQHIEPKIEITKKAVKKVIPGKTVEAIPSTEEEIAAEAFRKQQELATDEMMLNETPSIEKIINPITGKEEIRGVLRGLKPAVGAEKALTPKVTSQVPLQEETEAMIGKAAKLPTNKSTDQIIDESQKAIKEIEKSLKHREFSLREKQSQIDKAQKALDNIEDKTLGLSKEDAAQMRQEAELKLEKLQLQYSKIEDAVNEADNKILFHRDRIRQASEPQVDVEPSLIPEEAGSNLPLEIAKAQAEGKKQMLTSKLAAEETQGLVPSVQSDLENDVVNVLATPEQRIQQIKPAYENVEIPLTKGFVESKPRTEAFTPIKIKDIIEETKTITPQSSDKSIKELIDLRQKLIDLETQAKVNPNIRDKNIADTAKSKINDINKLIETKMPGYQESRDKYSDIFKALEEFSLTKDEVRGLQSQTSYDELAKKVEDTFIKAYKDTGSLPRSKINNLRNALKDIKGVDPKQVDDAINQMEKQAEDLHLMGLASGETGVVAGELSSIFAWANILGNVIRGAGTKAGSMAAGATKSLVTPLKMNTSRAVIQSILNSSDPKSQAISKKLQGNEQEKTQGEFLMQQDPGLRKIKQEE